MFKVSAVPPRRAAMLTVFRGATAINDGTTAEPLRPWRCNYGLCRTSTAVAPRLRCDGGRRSAVMTILRDATAINDGTTAIMAVSLRNHGDNGGATAVYAVQAPQWYRASGVTGVLPQISRLGAGMKRSATGLIVKRFDRSNGLDTVLYKTYICIFCVK